MLALSETFVCVHFDCRILLRNVIRYRMSTLENVEMIIFLYKPNNLLYRNMSSFESFPHVTGSYS